MTAPTPADDPQAPPPDSGMTAAQLAALLALVQAQAALRQQIVDTAVAAIVNPLRALGSDVWWNDAAYRKVVTSALKIVQPAQRNVARQTDAYITRATKLITGRTPQAAGAIDVTKLRRAITPKIAAELLAGDDEPGFVVIGDTHDGPSEQIDEPLHLAVPNKEFVDPAEPYERVAESYRYQVIAEGVPEVDARKRALVRLAVVTETDITLAVRAQYQKTLGKQNAHGYRRILHPEKAKFGHSCGLCVVAADRIYKVKDLEPIHLRCNCEVLPIYVMNGQRLDPGISLNWKELQSLYEAGGGSTGKDVLGIDGRMHSGGLKKVRVALAEHGELGPVLVDADHKFRGPKTVAETKSPDPAVQLRHQYNQLLEQHERTRAKAAAGDKTSVNAARWQTNRIAELERDLARL